MQGHRQVRLQRIREGRSRLLGAFAVQHPDARAARSWSVGSPLVRGGQTDQATAQHATGQSRLWPTTSRLAPPWRRKTTDVGSLISIAAPSQARGGCGDSRAGADVDQSP